MTLTVLPLGNLGVKGTVFANSLDWVLEAYKYSRAYPSSSTSEPVLCEDAALRSSPALDIGRGFRNLKA